MAEKVVIIDNGSHSIKAGFAGDETPKCIVLSLLGDKKEGDKLVGDAVREEIDMGVPVQTVRCPIDRGIITDWDGMVTLWKEVFRQLEVEPSNCKILVTDSPSNSQENRDKLVSTLFEQFKPRGVNVANQAAMAMYATGRMTGLVVDCGDGATHLVPVYEGYKMKEESMKFSFGGRDIADLLEQALKTCNPEEAKWSAFDPQTILVKYGKVAEDYEKEVTSSNDHEHTLSSGAKVKVNAAATYSPELLFKPQLADPESEAKGLPQVIDTCIKKCDMDCRVQLMSNIILVGGNSLIPGFPERLSKEIVALSGPKCKVIVKPERNFYPWIGGSIIASLPEFKDKWITKEEFEQKGVAIVAEKCA